MLPDIRVEQFQEAADKVSYDVIKLLTKYWIKIKLSDRNIAYATKDRIDKFLQGEDYRAMYLKVRDELAKLQQKEWVALTVEEVAEAGKLHIEGERMLPYSFARAIEQALREKNGY